MNYVDVDWKICLLAVVAVYFLITLVQYLIADEVDMTKNAGQSVGEEQTVW